jgi:hypothetical protein
MNSVILRILRLNLNKEINFKKIAWTRYYHLNHLKYFVSSEMIDES